MKKFLFFLFLSLIILLSTEATAQCLNSDPTDPEGIVGDYRAGNTPNTGVKVDPPNPGTYALGPGFVTISFLDTDCGQVMKWVTTGPILIDSVQMKADGYLNYDYTSTNPRAELDSMLHAPVNPSGKYADVSHVEFHFSLNYSLEVSKTAETSLDRTYIWDIEKFCEGDDTLNLNTGDTFNYPFAWAVSVVDSADTNWTVQGVIKVKNPTPYTVQIDSLSDFINPDGIWVILDCPETFPFDLPAGDSLMCTYLEVLPDGSARTNKIVAYSGNPDVKSDSAEVNFDFDDAVVNMFDTSITVTDDCGDPVVVNISDAPDTNYYSCVIGPYNDPGCNDTNYVNRVSFMTADLEVTGSDSCEVAIRLFGCETSCTLTPGYWKTHSALGPAPYDSTWELLNFNGDALFQGHDEPFFLSGQTAYEVLWTPPSGGNAYYILAHAYIAAALNFLNGADPTDAQEAFDDATDLFEVYTPAQIAGLKGNAKKTWTDLAKTLDDYNNNYNGLGPGHCSEEVVVILSKDGNSQVVNEQAAPQVQTQVIPDEYSLSQNYPNPFNPSTTISYGMPTAGHVTLKIYDLLGKEIATLVNETVSAGMHTITLDASKLPSGVYLYKIQSGSFVETKKMVLMK